ncbi:hypothetical protein HELRODRAFT_170427 [Helobdella robusta]|uniref:D-isomer specific 2-hydroxyacid dehydrogenase NAD-binding domain-containing protein n=1 Tax=Helobdella robusta TaxID=6412 RepID=T1F316_HELRO|nr:hypothetical protein HELRODRAFT_170427 [Helobdella robusta]ESO07126.1 hypothetical protein HELRODRAFT_170427 [Helobdella robusta]
MCWRAGLHQILLKGFFYTNPSTYKKLHQSTYSTIMAFKIGVSFSMKWKKKLEGTNIVQDCDSDLVPDDMKQTLSQLDIIVCLPYCFRNKEFKNSLKNITWVHSFSTGVEMMMDTFVGETPKFILTRNAGFFDNQMAEYVVGQIISRERHFEYYKTQQAKKNWKFKSFRLLRNLTAGIIGYGSIGKRVAECLRSLNMNVIALSRNAQSNGSKDANAVSLTNDLVTVLASSDYIISILPHTNETNGFFDGQVLQHCQQKKPCFINIGRGNAISDKSVIEALDNDWLSHAILDVFEEEPLPSGSPLWEHKGITITPHVSWHGIDPVEFVKNFLKNYELFCNGQPLKHQVDWGKGY